MLMRTFKASSAENFEKFMERESSKSEFMTIVPEARILQQIAEQYLDCDLLKSLEG